ncbi:hypothetical protein PV396_38260 [Streptomyces sp. ME02-8801-2C]|uniref:hypothetical protein n=1 Tax=Streptomyces sp. ME02-8801-2C TaxID=3028680 RepID=UPI0029BAD0D4|nr:hypothetical protein [Streptomyces sp. ME02-8801-2C]MDX3457731.1 hypothetical protein [Streptomyces sp. ME02-8801-2C]
MTTNSLPRLPRRNPTLTPRAVRTPSWTPSGSWAAPTPEVLRTLEAALARWAS